MLLTSTEPGTVLLFGKESGERMRVLSTELRQVFRAYTRQLKPTDARDEKGSEALHMRKGYEQVSLSEEAMKLSSSDKNEPKETPPDAS